jgi:hypothetical protein
MSWAAILSLLLEPKMASRFSSPTLKQNPTHEDQMAVDRENAHIVEDVMLKDLA